MAQLFSIVLGAILTVTAIIAAGNLIEIPLSRALRFTTGAALLSLIVFLLLTIHAGYWAVYVLLPVILTSLGGRPRLLTLPRMPFGFKLLFTAAGAFCFIYALAPEIQADAAGYHLRIVSEYVRLHGFSVRDGFYDVLPQGMEMLFVPAFALGAWSAAKLVHFAFLLATIPLIRELAREAGLTNSAACAAAALFFLAPVCGVSGTSAYTDAGLVCACCAVILLLIRWDRERLPALLVCAAINAGFCYAVKPTFGWVALAAVAFIAIRNRKSAILFACIALAVTAPWMIRAYALSGSPIAPFMSHWIPNRVLTIDLERRLVSQYSAFRSNFAWRRMWIDYTLFGTNQGIFGPAFLLIPLIFFARRNRWVAVCSLLLAIPFLFNTGARFLMPAMALAAVGIVAVLPRRIALMLVAIQAIGALPPILALYDTGRDWRLGSVPFTAALRLKPEAAYLRQSIYTFPAAEMIATSTPPEARILACTMLPEAYIPRELLSWWHSRLAQGFTDALHFAMMSQGTRARLVSWRWPENRHRILRITPLSELRIVDATLAGARSWRTRRPGETITFSAPGGVNGADVLIWPGDQARETPEVLPAEEHAFNIDLRRDATAYIRRSGYEYIVLPVADDPFAEIGVDMVRHSAEWGVAIAGESRGIYLFRINAALL